MPDAKVTTSRKPGDLARASHFTPQAPLGEQHPARASQRLPAAIVLSYLLVLALLLATGTRIESWFSAWFELQSISPILLGPVWFAAGLAVVIVAVGACYRPLGGQLSFGALPVPVLALSYGSAAASFVGFAGTLLAALTLRRLSKRDPQAPRDRRGVQRLLLDSAVVGISTLLASVTWAILAGPWPHLAIALSVTLWVASAYGLEQLLLRTRTTARATGRRRQPAPSFGLLWDALGWTLAASLALVAVTTGPAALVPAVIGYLTLTTVGASRELDRKNHLRRIRDLQTVGSMAQRLVPSERASELADQCLAEVRRTIDFSHFELQFESSGGREIFCSLARGPLLTGAAQVPEHPPMAPGIHARKAWVLLERDLLSRPAGDDPPQRGGDMPAPAPPQRLGRLRLWLNPRNTSGEEESLITDLVPQIAALIDRSRLDREARLDALTGLTRRHVFDRELESRLAVAQEDGHSVALLLFDLDNFKVINDSYGHDAGDRVLESVAEVLLHAAEPGGLACRWGGEEMALLQWGGGDSALVFADEIRHYIAAQEISTDAGKLRVTTSVGVAAFPDLLLQDASEMMKLADAALYAAKEHGRNRALVACGRGRFKGPSGELVGELGQLDPRSIPQL